MIVLGGEEGLECEACIDGIRLDHVSEFKYFGCVLDELGTDEAECSKEVASRRRVARAIRSLLGAIRSLHLECTMVLHESLLVPVLTYGNEKRGLGLGLYRWTNSEICWGSKEWIKTECTDKVVVRGDEGCR